METEKGLGQNEEFTLSISRNCLPFKMACANNMDRDQAPQNVGPDLRSILFDTWYNSSIIYRKVICTHCNECRLEVIFVNLNILDDAVCTIHVVLVVLIMCLFDAG